MYVKECRISVYVVASCFYYKVVQHENVQWTRVHRNILGDKPNLNLKAEKCTYVYTFNNAPAFLQ